MSDSSPKRPELTFFLDRALGLYDVAARLRAARMAVVTHAEFGLAPDADDVEWIPEVARAGHVILTKDKKIRLRTLELSVVLRESARYFTLGRQHYTAEKSAAIILDHRATIEDLVRNSDGPVVAQLNAGEILLRGADGKLVPVKKRRR